MLSEEVMLKLFLRVWEKSTRQSGGKKKASFGGEK